jgi:hypothetical protein
MNEGDYSDTFAFKDFACIVVEVCLRLEKYMTRLVYQFVGHQVHVVIQNLKMVIPGKNFCDILVV